MPDVLLTERKGMLYVISKPCVVDIQTWDTVHTFDL